jgi:hypothetical protein
MQLFEGFTSAHGLPNQDLYRRAIAARRPSDLQRRPQKPDEVPPVPVAFPIAQAESQFQIGMPFRAGTARPQTRRARAADFVSVLPLGFAELPFRHVDVPFCQVEVTLREQHQHFDAGKG